MEFRLLGHRTRRPRDPLAGRQHALLGLFLLHAPDTVAMGHVLDAPGIDPATIDARRLASLAADT